MKLGFVIPIVEPAVSGAPLPERVLSRSFGMDGSYLAHGPQMARSLDPVLLWTVAAAATSRMRLNASMLSTFYCEPPHLARLLATLDGFSDGRLGIGVGLGWMKQEYDIARNADWHRRGKSPHQAGTAAEPVEDSGPACVCGVGGLCSTEMSRTGRR